jgi:hypothetical protein
MLHWLGEADFMPLEFGALTTPADTNEKLLQAQIAALGKSGISRQKGGWIYAVAVHHIALYCREVGSDVAGGVGPVSKAADEEGRTPGSSRWAQREMLRRVLLDLAPATASDILCYNPSADGGAAGGSSSQWWCDHPHILPTDVSTTSCRCMGTLRQALKEMPEVQSRYAFSLHFAALCCTLQSLQSRYAGSEDSFSLFRYSRLIDCLYSLCVLLTGVLVLLCM